MQSLTQNFLETLKELGSINKIKAEIFIEHRRLKNKLKEKGYEILQGWEIIQSGQVFYDDDINLAHHYTEVYSMIQGITTGWVQNIDHKERFDAIRHQLNLIFENKKKLNQNDIAMFNSEDRVIHLKTGLSGRVVSTCEKNPEGKMVVECTIVDKSEIGYKVITKLPEEFELDRIKN
jgi:hypothetical protein